MLLADLESALHAIAPLDHAEPWDKVGLLVGDRHRPLSGPILLTIDLTEPVLAEAIAARASAVVAYHPPIFEPLTKITDATPRQRLILHAIEHHIAIYSPHTALDAVPGGVTDWLCEGLSASTTPGKIAGDCRALQPHASLPATQQIKIVTFVPPESLDQVRSALATAGAGIIGHYNVCSFAVEGAATFLGDASTHPTVGHAGHLEHVRELRLEMVCAKAALPLALETLRRFHPYEEPAIDAYDLVPQPRRNAGPGRRLVLDRPATILELAARLKAFVKRDRVRYAPFGDPNRPISHLGVVPGSGAKLSRLARQEGCELFVTGEMNHHDILGALHSGMAVLLGGHTNTERGYLPRLKSQLEQRLPKAKVHLSAKDADPLESF